MFTPDYTNLLAAASNREAARLPLYEHAIAIEHMEHALKKQFAGMLSGNMEDKKEYFRNVCEFYARHGYDTVSFECTIGPAMPGSGSLGSHVPGVVKTRDDFEKYPWKEIPAYYAQMYHDAFRALQTVLPPGMKAVGGVGNGVFECVQDIVGYMDLCYIREDDPALYADLFTRVGQVGVAIWEAFLREFSDAYCVLRFGDDLGFKSNTLISDEDIRAHVIPVYRDIISLVHSYGKKFLLHSCGCIFNVMDDLIAAGIDAKHSNEDQIALFPVWVERYGDKIGNFGGIDTDAVCRLPRGEMKPYILDVIGQCAGHGGFAFGSGNSIPDYVPYENFLAMTEIVREHRGDFCA